MQNTYHSPLQHFIWCAWPCLLCVCSQVSGCEWYIIYHLPKLSKSAVCPDPTQARSSHQILEVLHGHCVHVQPKIWAYRSHSFISSTFSCCSSMLKRSMDEELMPLWSGQVENWWSDIGQLCGGETRAKDLTSLPVLSFHSWVNYHFSSESSSLNFESKTVSTRWNQVSFLSMMAGVSLCLLVWLFRSPDPTLLISLMD